MDAGEVKHGGGLAEAAARYGGSPADWLDLSTGINPVPAALPDLSSAVWARLPDRDLMDDARAAAARFYATSGCCLPLPAPGTQAAIQRLPALAGNRGDAAILGHTYGEYAHVFARAGLRVDIIDRLSGVSDRHRIVVVVNPNNPDGRIVARDDLLALADRMAARSGFLVVDEAFADANPVESLAADAGGDGLIVFRSFGKFFGLAGLRLGFVLASPSTAERFAQAFGPWAVSGPALAAAAALMRDEAGISRLKRSIAERGGAMRAVLHRAKLTIRGETPLFFLVEHSRAGALRAALCNERILVRAFDYAPDWLRIGLSPDPAADRRFEDALLRCGQIVSGAAVA